MFKATGTPQQPVKRKALDDADPPPKRRKIDPGTRRQVIGRSVLPAGLLLASRRYVNTWSCFAIDLAGSPAVAREPKWITVRRDLYTNPDRTQPDLGSKSPGTVKLKKGSTKNTQGDSASSMDIASGASTMRALDYGNGTWALSGLASGPVPKGGRRDLQLLSQLSQLLFNALAKKNVKTYEVEAMVVNGRILVSANEPPATAALATLKLNDIVPDCWSTRAVKKQTTGNVAWEKVKPRKIADICAALLPSDPARAVAAKVGLRRLIQLQVDCQLVPDQHNQVSAILTTLHTMLNSNLTLIKGGDRDAVARLINDPGHAGKIIVVDAVTRSHAEQNLVAAAIAAALRPTNALTPREKLQALGPISVAGCKRPCSTCWFTIALARRYGLDIHCNWHPGGLWKGSTQAGMQNVADLLGIEKAKLTKELEAIRAAMGFTQYVTDNSVTAPRSKKVEDLPTAVLFTTRVSTGNDSGSESEDNDSQTLSAPPPHYAVFGSQDSQPMLYLEPEPDQDTAEKSPGSDSDEGSETGDAVVPGDDEVVFDDIADPGTGPSPDDADKSGESDELSEEDGPEGDDEEPSYAYDDGESDDWQDEEGPDTPMSIVKEES